MSKKLLLPFDSCRRKVNPVYILRANGSLSAVCYWSKKCGTEKGTDSGQYFFCFDCVLKFEYRLVAGRVAAP
jgi:hypothetical protein